MSENATPPQNGDSPHLTRRQVEQLRATLGDADASTRADVIARLAWRPAWAIRRRRGVLTTIAAMFKSAR